MDAYTPMSSGPSTPGFDTELFTVSPADTHLRQPSVSFAEDVKDSPATQEKKPAKKRKSWGQELPIPTTNLPPRKRAKTEAEKEQRRVERVIRNRNAAHASRERKRVQVESLEQEKDEIQSQRDTFARENEQLKHENQLLKDQLAQLSALMNSSNHATPQSFADAPSPTLTPQLFKQETQDTSSTEYVPNHPSPLAHTAFPTPSTLDESVATPSELTQHPAVSFGRYPIGSSTTDSIHGGYLFHPGPISDDHLNDLLLGDPAPASDLHFSEMGQKPELFTVPDSNGFDFNELVDFEALNDTLDSPIDFSGPPSTQVASMHTGHGASILRCDGHGIAVGDQ